MASLDDIKSASQNDNNASKALALDHLGVIAGRLRSAMLKFERAAAKNAGNEGSGSLKPIEEVRATVITIFMRKFTLIRLCPERMSVSFHIL